MNVGSCFSGIGGMDAGLARAGHRHLFFCEADPYRRQVLAARWPGVPIYDDVRGVHASPDAAEGRHGGGGVCGAADRGRAARADRKQGAVVDLLCGGFPCQDLSVAGKRAGLAGDRSGLFFEFARIAEALRPRWILLENVPGLLSSQGGRDFGVVLGTLADLGYGVAWRVLDSRFFGVPQRRRRVFIVGARAEGDPRAAAERAGQVLAVGSRCPGHPATGGQAGQDVAVASISGLGNGGPDDNDGQAGRLVAETPLVAAPLTKGSATGDGVNQPGRRQEDDVNLISFDAEFSNQGEPSEHAVLTRKLRRAISSEATGVRRLTPRECERLQGLPDGWTQLGDTPDSRRYSALGDAVTATVAEWIGERLAEAAA